MLDEEAILERLWKAPVVAAVAAGLGFVLFLAAGGGLLLVENKAIHPAVSLEQGSAQCRTAVPERVDPANEGRLVYLKGEAVPGSPAVDEPFGVKADALRMTREVETYQWEEEKKESKKDNKTTVTYAYKK